MKVSSTGTFVWVAVMAVAVIAMLVDATSLPPILREMPTLLGSAVLVLFALLLVGEVYPRPSPGWIRHWRICGRAVRRKREALAKCRTPLRNNGAANAVPWPSVLRVLAYIVGFWALVFLLGLYLVPPLFIIFFLVAEAGVRLRHAVMSALVACAFLFTGLHLLEIDLWVGVAPEILPGIVGGAVMPTL